MSEGNYPNLEKANLAQMDNPPPYPFPNSNEVQGAPAEPLPPGFIHGGSAPPEYNVYNANNQNQPQPIQQQPTQVIITTIGPQTHFSQRMICPNCNADVATKVTPETGALTHICALGLCFVVCWPCCLIPYCVDGCKDTIHTCPNCKNTLGVVKRL